MKTPEYVLLFIVLLICVCAFVFVLHGVEKEKQCEDSGGAYLKTFTYYKCIKVN